MKKLKFYDLFSIAIIVLVLASAAYFYPLLPDRVITHWNGEGVADGWGSKSVLVVFMPLLIIGLYILFKFIPKMDPKKENYLKFDSVYHLFKLMIVAFMAIVYFISVFINLGYDLPISDIMIWLMGILFIVLGLLIRDVKQNWFMGIRTPWTLSNEEVWTKTHILAQKVFILGGVAFLFVPYMSTGYLPIVVIVVVVAIISISYGYSYWLYKKLEKRG